MRVSSKSAKHTRNILLGTGLAIWMVLSCNNQEERTLTRPQAGVVTEVEGGGRRRADWAYLQRAYPRETIPPAARVIAIREMEQEERRREEEWRRSSNQPGWTGMAGPQEVQPAWTACGPMPIRQGQTLGTPRVAVSGRVSTVVLHPGYDGATNQTIYLGAAQGGLWRSKDNGAEWIPLTDGQPSLAMGAIAIDPTNSDVIYAGTGEAHFAGDSYYGAGLLKSMDCGATWTQIDGPISALPPNVPSFLNASFHTLVVDPVIPSTLFAATEAGATSSAVDFVSSSHLGDRGIWKSTDAGITWRNVNPARLSVLDKAGTDVLIDPLDHQRVFAAVWGLGIYRSNSGGEPGTWKKLTTGLPGSGFIRIKLAAGPPLAPSTRSTLYAALAASDFDTLRGIFKSTDSGTTWSEISRPQLGGQSFYNLALAIDPIDANILYYGTSANPVNDGGTLWRSKNGGTTWADISRGNGVTGGLHVDTHWVTISPTNHQTLFVANDGGVWRTDNATDTVVGWKSLNQTISITQFQTIALHPTDPNRLLGGTQDNGTDRYDGVLTWFQSRGGDGGCTIIDQSDPQKMYHTFYNVNNFGGQRPQIGAEMSLDGGNTWSTRRRGCFGCTAQTGNINPADRVGMYAPMGQHPGFQDAVFGNVLYFATHRLYRSADAGLTWTGLGASADGFGADLTNNTALFSYGFPAFVSAIAVDPVLDRSTDPPGETVWSGSGDGRVMYTVNAGRLGGATFTDATRAPLPRRFMTDIALDPLNPLRVVVTFSGFDANTSATPGHVFLTNDKGGTWENISGNLPDIPVNSVALDPMRVRVMYIGTDIGVFQTTDDGVTWLRLANGMPQVATFMLRFHAPTRNLVAATHGRGVFRLRVE